MGAAGQHRRVSLVLLLVVLCCHSYGIDVNTKVKKSPRKQWKAHDWESNPRSPPKKSKLKSTTGNRKGTPMGATASGKKQRKSKSGASKRGGTSSSRPAQPDGKMRDKRRKQENRPPSSLKKYGLIRNVLARMPFVSTALLSIVVHWAHMAAHGLLITGLIAESIKPTLGPFAPSILGGEAKRFDALLQLGALGYDVVLGCAAAVDNFAWLVGLPILSEEKSAVVRRLATLQTCAACLLYFATAGRFKRRASVYTVPPLFQLLAYFAAPWAAFAVWLLGLQPGHRKLFMDVGVLGFWGSGFSDLGVLVILLLVRTLTFGRHGILRLPKTRRTLADWAWDSVVFFFICVLFDFLLCFYWLEHVENWKYVFCVMHCAWLPYVVPLALLFFRNQGTAVASEGPTLNFQVLNPLVKGSLEVDNEREKVHDVSLAEESTYTSSRRRRFGSRSTRSDVGEVVYGGGKGSPQVSACAFVSNAAIPPGVGNPATAAGSCEEVLSRWRLAFGALTEEDNEDDGAVRAARIDD